MRRKWKAMEKRHRGRVAQAGVDLPPKQAMEDFMKLHARRWPEGVSEFLRPAAQVFHQRLAALWIPKGRTVLPYIEIEGRMAGSIYGLVEDDTAYLFQMGWDPAYEDISMGKLAMACSVQDAMARHASRYDMLPGDFEYKKSWGDGIRRVLDIEAFRAFSARAAAFRTLRAAKRLLRHRSENPTPQLTRTP
jgi:CelD/BcsL family acetyltransferase involved in cellulose biosynthesis